MIRLRYLSAIALSMAPVAPGNAAPGTLANSVNELTASEMEYVARRVEGCWRSDHDVDGRVKVIVRVRLHRDGTVEGEPVALEPATLESELVRKLAGRAVSAVKNCAPYDQLDAAGYERWKMFDMRFGTEPSTR
jgi:hypothetical protein